jgi:hypothetical protein
MLSTVSPGKAGAERVTNSLYGCGTYETRQLGYFPPANYYELNVGRSGPCSSL